MDTWILIAVIGLLLLIVGLILFEKNSEEYKNKQIYLCNWYNNAHTICIHLRENSTRNFTITNIHRCSCMLFYGFSIRALLATYFISRRA